MVILILVVALIDLQLSYILAFFGKDQIAESLSSTIAETIIGVMLAYCLKALFETFFEKREERLNKQLEKKNRTIKKNRSDKGGIAMPFYFLTTALLIVSLVTNLTVEGIKKLLADTKIKYSSNVLAAVSSVVIAFAVSVIYMIMNDVALSLKIGVEVVILMYLGFLTSTIGYDKVIQTIKQIQETKDSK